MKNNIIIGLIIAIVIAATGLGVRAYYVSAERTLIANYTAEIKDNNKKIADYRAQNEEYKARLLADSILIVSKNKEIALYKAQYIVIKSELKDAKNAIKDFTAGEAISMFIEYSGANDSKMLVQNSDTSLIITTPSVLKIDEIFVEHKFQKLEIVNLGQTVNAQDRVILLSNQSLENYKSIVINKDSEIDILHQNAKLNFDKWNLKIQKLKAQRNRSRWLLGGAAAVAITPYIIKLVAK